MFTLGALHTTLFFSTNWPSITNTLFESSFVDEKRHFIPFEQSSFPLQSKLSNFISIFWSLASKGAYFGEISIIFGKLKNV